MVMNDTATEQSTSVCPHCQESVKPKAKRCPHCREKIKRGIGAGGVLGILILIGVMGSIVTSATPTTPSSSDASAPATTPKVDMHVIEKSVNGLIATGLIKKIDASLNEAYVDGANWASLSIDDKKNVGRALAYYVGSKKGTNLYWVDIIDWKSDTKLAKYSDSWGFKAY